MHERKTVLVLDGETRAALAVVRSLGRNNLKVIVAGESKYTLAGSSRFCAHSLEYSSPLKDINKFILGIRELITKEKVDVLIPVTDPTTYAVLQNRSLLDDITEIPLVPFETYWAASDKISLTKTANKLNIPVPSTIYIDPSSDNFEDCLSNLTFPVIIKPRATIQSAGNAMRTTKVRFAENRQELLRIISTDQAFKVPYMLQEVIKGEGIGILAFCVDGEIVRVYSHRRIREKPPYGGVSVVCESTQPDTIALESSKKLLKGLNWSGVTMVEFKRDSNRNNIPVLMEINARFWGSLQLALDSGLEFPFYLYQLSQKVNISSSYKFKMSRSRWLLGDLDHLIIRLKTPYKDVRYPQRLRDKIGAVFIFLNEFFRNSKIEEFRYRDTGPFFYSLKIWIKKHLFNFINN